jgi:hypothetical protein
MDNLPPSRPHALKPVHPLAAPEAGTGPGWIPIVSTKRDKFNG